MVYKWKEGARMTIDAQIAGNVCAELETQNALTAKNLLNVSRPEEAPLHKAFEWSDDIAAERWREHQARNIINSLVVSVESPNADSVRCFFKVEQAEPEYHSMQTILQEEDSAQKLLENALRELQSFQRKYSVLKELHVVFAEIDKLHEMSA